MRAAVRTSSVVLTERTVRDASEPGHQEKYKQESCCSEFYHFVFLHPTRAYLAQSRSRRAARKEHSSSPHVQNIHMGSLKVQPRIVVWCECKPMAEGSKR